MNILGLLLILVVSSVKNQPSEGLCINFICQANVSTVVTVPCGDYNENDGVVFSYYNWDSGEVLLANTTLYYRLNVTVFDDETKIACQPHVSGLDAYQYRISVVYPPQISGHNPVVFAEPGEEVIYTCPLIGNPPPVCSWEFMSCGFGSMNEVPHGISYADNNCSLVIHKLSPEFLNMCYKCYATNSLGTSEIHLLEIRFSVCPPIPYAYIMTYPVSNSQNNSYIQVQEGQDLNLTCVVSASCVDFVLWREFYDCDCKDYSYCNDSACISWTVLSFVNISKDDSGTYTCIAPEIVYGPSSERIPPESITVDVISSANGCYNQKLRYSIYLSFAKEDLYTAITTVKNPLEENGYTFCWNHAIEECIEESQVAIILLSKSYAQSEAHLEEWYMIRNRYNNDCIVPVRVDESETDIKDLVDTISILLGSQYTKS